MAYLPEQGGEVVEDGAAPVCGQAWPDLAGADGHAGSPSAARRSRSWIASRVSLVPTTSHDSGRRRLVAATASRNTVPPRWATWPELTKAPPDTHKQTKQ